MVQQSMVMSQQQRLQMVLAPQLRQSLEMLQLPLLELQTLIRVELEKNPTLEELPLKDEEAEAEAPKEAEEPEEPKELDFSEDFEVLAKLDDEWRSYFFQEEGSRTYTPQDAQKRQFLLDSLPQTESLQEHLMKQLELAGLSESDRQIGELLVGNINDDGYLASSMEEISETAGLDVLHAGDVLHIVQDFNPVGVGARNLRECLLLQLERVGDTESLAYIIVDKHIEKLAGRKYQDLARILKVDPDDVHAAAEQVGRLDPKPGSSYSTEVATYVFPDVLVQKLEGKYVVILNDEQLPRLRISNHYRTLMRAASTTPEVKEYITEKVRAGVFMIKSIQQRQQTLFKIATEIVNVQAAFLDKGLTHLTPLTMSQVADVVSVHETTVSRAVSGKYMKTPSGIFDMKYFFTPGLKTSSGKDISNKTVKDIIAQIIASEDAEHPLSDQEILGKLSEKGINIARRTVAKYRIVLHIPASHMRKTY